MYSQFFVWEDNFFFNLKEELCALIAPTRLAINTFNINIRHRTCQNKIFILKFES